MMKLLTLSLLVSTGILSLVLLIKLSIPLLTNQAPLLWISLSSWLKPPYLYLILNCIIITIAASSRFHRDDENGNNKSYVSRPVSQKISVREPEFQFHYDMKVTPAEVEVETEPVVEPDEEEEGVKVLQEVQRASEVVFEDKSNVKQEDEDEDEFIISKSNWIPSRRIVSSENTPELTEKPLVSSRFGNRKPVRASPEGGRAVRVAKPKRHETLENTWKMITEGRPMPLTKHFKKSETFDYSRPDLEAFASKKSETFKDRTNYQSPPVNNGNYSTTKLGKEPSLSQDELNKRVEAFIKKFNEEMRMQRQESLNQYNEMINKGSR